MGARELVLGVALISLAACATAPAPAKPRALTPAERDSLSQILDPLLTAAGLWRGPADGCAADFGVLEGDLVGVALMPHAPCRVRLILTEGTLVRLDRETLRALLAHEIAQGDAVRPQLREQLGPRERGIPSKNSQVLGGQSDPGGWRPVGAGPGELLLPGDPGGEGHVLIRDVDEREVQLPDREFPADCRA